MWARLSLAKCRIHFSHISCTYCFAAAAAALVASSSFIQFHFISNFSIYPFDNKVKRRKFICTMPARESINRGKQCNIFHVYIYFRTQQYLLLLWRCFFNHITHNIRTTVFSLAISKLSVWKQITDTSRVNPQNVGGNYTFSIDSPPTIHTVIPITIERIIFISCSLSLSLSLTRCTPEHTQCFCYLADSYRIVGNSNLKIYSF